MEEIVGKILESQVTKSIVVLLCSYIIYIILKMIIDKGIKKSNLSGKRKGKKATYAKLFTNIIKYLFLIITALVVLQINGVDVSSMIAGLGIAGLISGLALQDALKDIIMGVNIITDNFFVVGDVVKYNNIEGKVISLGLKTTKIQDIYTNNIVSITNRNIDKITTVSNWLDLDIPISYDAELSNVEDVLKKAGEQIQKNEKVEKCEYLGTNEFADSSIIYKVRVYCLPEFKPTVKRAALKEIRILLNENNISIPYQQIDVHNV